MGRARLAVAALLLAAGGCSTSTPRDAACPDAAGAAGVYLPPDGVACERLTSWGLFADGTAPPRPTDGAVAYDVRTPLFSDYAAKYRQVWMPDGTRAVYREDGTIELPVGTVLAKTFAYPADPRHPDGALRLLETRLLVHRAGGWEALTYTWNEAQDEAFLQPLGGRHRVTTLDAGGRPREIDYLVPNVNQCAECHGKVDPATGRDRLEPIGTVAAQMNRDFPYPDGAENQLARFARLGRLAGAPADLDAAPRLAVWDDPATGDLDARARAYLDANCGHCHEPRGTASTSGLVLASGEREPRLWGVCKPPIRTSSGRAVDLHPGRPDASDLVHRLESLDPREMMPKLGRTVVHDEGAALVRAWVEWLGTPEATAKLGLADPGCVATAPSHG